MFDLDGTLFFRDQMISENAVNKIIELEQKGITIGLATGRFYSELDSFVKSLKLKEFKGFVICANGAEIYDFSDDSRIEFKKIDRTRAYEILNLATKHNLISYVHEDSNYHVFSRPIYKNAHKLMRPVFLKVDTPFFKAAAALKLEGKPVLNKSEYDKLCFAGTKTSINHFINKIKSRYDEYTYYRVSKFAVEITDKSVGKYAACSMIMNKKNLTLNHVIFFGDGGNDEELLHFAGLGIAMKNALPSTKKAAHRVSEFTNREDGVYKELVKLFD